MDATRLMHWSTVLPQWWQALCTTPMGQHARPEQETAVRLFALSLLLREEGIDARPMALRYVPADAPAGPWHQVVAMHVDKQQVIGLAGERSWDEIIRRDFLAQEEGGGQWVADAEAFIPCPVLRPTLDAFLAEHRARLLAEHTAGASLTHTTPRL